MSNVIITGGAGFIGSHLAKRLVSEGNNVLVIDNLITKGSIEYIKDLIESPNFKFINKDICDINTAGAYRMIEEEFKDGVDYLYNLASPASVKLYTRNPLLTFRTSTIGVTNMLELGLLFGSRNFRFLETSTSEAYGDPLIHPQYEEYFGNVNTQCERSCYDEGKRSAEVLCYIHNKKYSVNTHIARIFNTYGPNNTDDRVMPTFILAAMEGRPIPVFGDGSQTRSFCYVDDTVDGLIRLINSDYHNPVNIGNPEEISILHLAKMINKKFNRNENNIKFLPLPEFDPKVRCPEITKAKEILNWEPKVKLSEGIDSVTKYLEECCQNWESNLL